MSRCFRSLFSNENVGQWLGYAAKILLAICVFICIYTLSRTTQRYTELQSRTSAVQWNEFRMEFFNYKLNYSLIRPIVDCGTPKLLVLVPTRPNTFRTRTSIRRSWADPDLTAQLNITVRFAVGQPEDDPLLEEILLHEMDLMKDLVISNIPDTYKNLNMKVYAALQWQRSFCPQADFILKVDDDVVLNPARLIYWIDKKFSNEIVDDKAAIFGYTLQSSQIVRHKSKWNVLPEELSGEVYPQYTLGMTYLLTSAAVPRILDAAPKVRLFKFEDVLFTGLMAEEANVTRYDISKHFRNSREIKKQDKCEDSVPLISSVFGYDADQIPQMYKKLLKVECEED